MEETDTATQAVEHIPFRERITKLTKRRKTNKIGSCLCCKTQEYFRVPRTWKVVRPIMKLYGSKTLDDYICFRCFFDFEKLKGEGKSE